MDFRPFHGWKSIFYKLFLGGFVMQQKLQALKSEAIEALNNATAVDMLNDLRVKYLQKR